MPAAYILERLRYARPGARFAGTFIVIAELVWDIAAVESIKISLCPHRRKRGLAERAEVADNLTLRDPG